MKIGILVKQFNELSNWELRVLDGIINNQELQLSLLIQDGRTGTESPATQKNKIKTLFKSKNILGKLLFKLQSSIEKKLYKEPVTADKDSIINRLKNIEVVKLKPAMKGALDIFSNEDAEIINKYDLDIIIRLEFNIIRGPLLESAKYGIWSFHYADNAINRSGSTGFWEILLKQPYVGVTLQQLTDELNDGLVIDKAYFNYHWSFVKTQIKIFEASVSVLFKNIRQLQRGYYSPSKVPAINNPIYNSPGIKHTLKYAVGFYTKLFSKFLERIKAKLFRTRYACWTLFIGKGEFMNSDLFKLKPVTLPKNEFWADPFIFSYKGEAYIFFENLSYTTNRGKISCGKIKNQQLVDISDVLDLDYHLSYPFIFEENGDIFLMPETSENNRLELYKCVSFPDKWELYSTAFEGEKVVDAFFYDDDNQQKWLFVNKQPDLTPPFGSELYIYKVDTLKMENLEPHLNNPLMIDSRKARNGGCIFKYKNEIYRPSQVNTEGIYGRGLNIYKIDKLTIDEYIEKEVMTVYPDFYKGLNSMHHLHQSDDFFVIDAAYKEL